MLHWTVDISHESRDVHAASETNKWTGQRSMGTGEEEVIGDEVVEESEKVTPLILWEMVMLE